MPAAPQVPAQFRLRPSPPRRRGLATYDRAADACCFSCQTRLPPPTPSGFPHLLGAWRSTCPACAIVNYFDLPTPPPEPPTGRPPPTSADLAAAQAALRQRTRHRDLFGGSLVTRASLLATGELVDVSLAAQAAGLKWSTAVTTELWQAIEVPTYSPGRRNNLDRILSAAVTAIARPSVNRTERFFDAFVLKKPAGGLPPRQDLFGFRLVSALGDHGEPTVTIDLVQDP